MDPRFPKSVVFITRSVNAGGAILYDPIGTGFVVRAHEFMLPFDYIVTARHVVEPHRRVYVKIRRADGTLHDIEAGDWVYHKSKRADLAASILAVQPDDYQYTPVPLSLPYGITYTSYPRASRHDMRRGVSSPPRIGDRVYYMGFLEPVPTMGDKMIPFVRSGIVGALDQERIPVHVEKSDKNPSGSEWVDGHLIDAHGQEGFSGSPCFVWKHVQDVEEVAVQLARRNSMTGRDYERLSIPRRRADPKLFGVFLGYFWVASGGRPINAGIGIVAPKDRLVELLMQPELVAHRAPAVEERRREIEREREEFERAAQEDDDEKGGDGT